MLAREVKAGWFHCGVCDDLSVVGVGICPSSAPLSLGVKVFQGFDSRPEGFAGLQAHVGQVVQVIMDGNVRVSLDGAQILQHPLPSAYAGRGDMREDREPLQRC